MQIDMSIELKVQATDNDGSKETTSEFQIYSFQDKDKAISFLSELKDISEKYE